VNKEYLVAIMMDVQAGTRSCRHAAKEVMEWSDEQAAEIAALKAEVEQLRGTHNEIRQSYDSTIKAAWEKECEKRCRRARVEVLEEVLTHTSEYGDGQERYHLIDPWSVQQMMRCEVSSK